MVLKAALCVLAISLCVNANNTNDTIERILIEDTEIARGTVIKKHLSMDYGMSDTTAQLQYRSQPIYKIVLFLEKNLDNTIDKPPGIFLLTAPSVVGCAIKSKPELYKFMLDIWGLYHNLAYDSNDDTEPQIIFYNYKNEVLKVTKIKNKTADEISAILDEAGFYKKSQKGEDVPKEFQHFPLKAPRDEL